MLLTNRAPPQISDDRPSRNDAAQMIGESKLDAGIQKITSVSRRIVYCIRLSISCGNENDLPDFLDPGSHRAENYGSNGYQESLE